MGTVVRVYGSLETVRPKNKIYFELDEMKYLLGLPLSSTIQIQGLKRDKMFLVCDEQPSPKRLSNKLADLKCRGQINGPIVGDVLFCSVEEVEDIELNSEEEFQDV